MQTNSKKILVIDDEPLIGESLKEALTLWNFDVTFTQESQKAINKLGKCGFDVVLSDIRMPQLTGMEILQKVKKISPSTGVVLMTAYGTIKQAVDALKIGAYDYLTKPFDLEQVKSCLFDYFRDRDSLLEKSIAAAASQPRDWDDFIGQSQKLQELFETLNLAYHSDAPVFIQSESGTGKEVVASLIHHKSARRDKPYLKINCASLPENLVESQLFGHERGAFTGAVKTSKGLFEEASGGTVLLDEITEMPIHLQAKLLRVLQGGEFTRVGSNQPIYTDVRVVATSNRDVQAAIKAGRFRQDLFFRLNVISLKIPPLRERADDIILLSDYFIKKYGQKYMKKINGIEKSALDYLQGYHWPGNVREFENVVHRCVLACASNEKISLEHLRKLDLFEKKEKNGRFNLNQDMCIQDMEKQLIRATLERHHFHKTKTAEILGITLKTLRNKILLYGLEAN
ncbi:MAG: sigma-54-dependent transcriptional regulator [bacterium]